MPFAIAAAAETHVVLTDIAMQANTALVAYATQAMLATRAARTAVVAVTIIASVEPVFDDKQAR